jgi:UDP-N-acetylmuramate dehydrogenase
MFVNTNVRNKLEKINIDGTIMFNVPMDKYTTFQTGGNADFFAVPSNKNDIIKLLKFSKKELLPVFILGGGANILVSDKGIRGLVIDLRNLTQIKFKNNYCTAEAGVSISKLAEAAAELSLEGLDFIYGMPGSVGGAVWMNARCYNSSISDVLVEVDSLTENLELERLGIKDINNSFFYKISPFQHSKKIILSVGFKLKKGIKTNILHKMKEHKEDREQKGHYRYPCAGSVFKNNRSFGNPSGKIIDSLGLKGYTVGNAKIADFHGNIIINTGNACSRDIKTIVEYTQKAVYEKYNYKLEPEIQFIGDWD